MSIPFASSTCWRRLLFAFAFLCIATDIAHVTRCAVVAAGAADTPTGAQKAISKESVSSIEYDFEYDENNKLITNYLVFPANRKDCSTFKMVGSPPDSGYESVEVEGDALQRIFPDYNPDGSDDRCMAACIEKGVDVEVAGYTMPHLHYESTGPGRHSTNAGGQRFEEWHHTACKRIEVCFINYQTRRPLKMYWLPPDIAALPREDDFDKKTFQKEIEYGERNTYCFFSFIGHVFEAYRIEDNGDIKFYERVQVDHPATRAFGTSPPSSSQRFDDLAELESNVKRALDTEWSKHFQVKRTFSSLGFAKGRLPNDVFASMAAFYYNNRNNVVNEEWTGKGFFVNWWETDVKFVSIPWDLKKRWQIRLAELVSAWSGVEVEQTSMYGLRQYEGGARLLSHVDRKPTHAVSLIVNVAQDNLAHPWPVEVFDHADRLHEIDMVAGDIVYYESAKNLHGRNRPLQCADGGCKFVNLFTHYRPVDDGAEWHSNFDDLPNRPRPLEDGDTNFDEDHSICTLTSDSQVNKGDIGVGTVDCQDSRLGSYISPTLYRATKANHLFEWWKATEDPNFIGYGHAKYMHGVDYEEENDNRGKQHSGTPSPPENENVYYDETEF